MENRDVRRHHEEIVAAPSILPALSMLLPLAGALWARIKSRPKNSGTSSSRKEGNGEL